MAKYKSKAVHFRVALYINVKVADSYSSLLKGKILSRGQKEDVMKHPSSI